MATCGNCKQAGQSVEHIRSCYAAKNGGGVAVLDRPMALETPTVPESMYALESNDKIVFFEVKTGKGKWSHMQFVDRLVGAPGDWQRYPVKGNAKRLVLEEISQDAKAAAVRFSKHFTVCAACGSPLTDPDSMALGLGPICAAKF